MIKIFSFKFGDIFNLSNIEKINSVMHSFLDNIDISGFTESYRTTFSNGNYERTEEVNKNNFIELKQYEDMYLLAIDLKGIDLRELSIRYDPGIIEINLNRLEIEKSSFKEIGRNILVKKAYNKKFENIEEIDTSQILKSIDNGILSMRMQKKYALESVSSIVDVDSYEDN
ncbi:MAG: Hsp20/alpha crystallin family protein [Clostridium sp.]|uniref:Hsp20/alpha crystallin family protein n=1 Tax=Clostridium sp. TaxID=1506 RepID=UPI0025BC0C21|nr:Hsp20/alpha crystallin family protein [Clostridium sp.]MCE5221323.1 Hsp20/alpha crystallin family protein [Clostridium sp.]